MTALHSKAPVASDTTFETILLAIMPHYLAAAGGDRSIVRKTVLEFLAAYCVATPPEIELAARIICFGAAAADSLRLSMRPGLPSEMVASMQKSAIALNRTAESGRATLEAMQQRRAEAEARQASHSAHAMARSGAAAVQPIPAPQPIHPRAAQPDALKPIVHNPALPDPEPGATHQDAAERRLSRPTIH